MLNPRVHKNLTVLKPVLTNQSVQQNVQKILSVQKSVRKNQPVPKNASYVSRILKVSARSMLPLVRTPIIARRS